MTNRQKVDKLLEKLINEESLTYEMILKHILENYLSGTEAYDALLSTQEEFYEDFSDEDDDISPDDFDDEEFYNED